MSQNLRRILILLIATISCISCGKKNEPPASPTVQPPAAQSTTSAPEPAPAAEAPADTDLDKKKKAMEYALKEDSIKNDPKGQWAINATASSSFASNLTDVKASYHPMQATGAPDVTTYGDEANSWATKEQDTGIEWLELEFAKPVNATQLRIRQSYNPGAIIKIEAYDQNNSLHTLWSGPDATAYPANQISWLMVDMEKTAYKTQKIKITLATNMVPGWNEIDAVQLIGE